MEQNIGHAIILGCGCSKGTPQIGNEWGACDPLEPKNFRTRPSIAIQKNGKTLIIDTGPDFHMQINRENIRHIDGVLYTHAHSDHVAGIDELRSFFDRTRKRVPVLSDEKTLNELRQRFSFVFEQSSVLYAAAAEAHILQNNLQSFAGIDFTPFTQDHGLSTTLGFRFGDFGYSTDMITLDDHAIGVLNGVENWLVDGANLYEERIFVHSNLKRILELQEKVQAKNIYLTHLKNNLDYQTLCRDLPIFIRPAFDGQKIQIKWGQNAG